MRKHIETILSATMAGVLIAIACSAYLFLKTDHQIIGAFLFGFGLLTVVTLDYKLYTGRIGYLIDKDKKIHIRNTLDYSRKYTGCVTHYEYHLPSKF